MTTNDPARLELDPEEMRALGYRAIDMLVDHWTNLADRPAAVDMEPDALRPIMREPLPEGAGDWQGALDFARTNVFETMGQIAHPRFFAFVPGPSNFVGAIADTLTSGYNTAASLWRETPGPAELELTTLEWLKELCGLHGDSEGVFYQRRFCRQSDRARRRTGSQIGRRHRHRRCLLRRPNTQLRCARLSHSGFSPRSTAAHRDR